MNKSTEANTAIVKETDTITKIGEIGEKLDKVITILKMEEKTLLKTSQKESNFLCGIPKGTVIHMATK